MRRITPQKETHLVWPYRPTILNNESLDSWMYRLAQGNGFTLYELLLHLLDGDKKTARKISIPVELSSISSYQQHELLNRLASEVGKPYEHLAAVSINDLVNRLLFEIKLRDKSHILLKAKSAKAKIKRKFKTQYCPRCLADDIPYFKRTWMLNFVVSCPVHDCLLLEKCHQCGKHVTYENLDCSDPIRICYFCEADLRQVGVTPVHPSVVTKLKSWMRCVNRCFEEDSDTVKEIAEVLRRLQRINFDWHLKAILKEYAQNQLNIDLTPGLSNDFSGFDPKRYVTLSWVLRNRLNRLQ